MKIKLKEFPKEYLQSIEDSTLIHKNLFMDIFDYQINQQIFNDK